MTIGYFWLEFKPVLEFLSSGFSSGFPFDSETYSNYEGGYL